MTASLTMEMVPGGDVRVQLFEGEHEKIHAPRRGAARVDYGQAEAHERAAEEGGNEPVPRVVRQNRAEPGL